MSTLPCFRSSASVTEKPLDTLISILGNSVAKNPGRGREPGGFLSGEKADGENRLGGTRGAARCLGGRFSLRQRQARVIEKGAAGGRQFDAAHAAGEKRGADFLLEVPHLAAEGGLRRMQAAFRCELHAAGLGDCDEIAKMPELHALGSIVRRHIRKLTKSFSARLPGSIQAAEQ